MNYKALAKTIFTMVLFILFGALVSVSPILYDLSLSIIVLSLFGLISVGMYLFFKETDK